jgi:hypothetical protein
VVLLSAGYWQAALAGMLFGVAILSTQKAVYVIALCVLLFATSTAARIQSGARSKAREFVLACSRLAVVLAVAAVVVGIYVALVPEAARLASGTGVAGAIDTMNWTRSTQGYRIYTVHAHRLIVHWVLFAILIAWTVRALIRKDRSEVVLLCTCWSILFLGLAVIRFHGSSFPYFIMTAGLFPALALSMASASPLVLTGRSAWPIIVSLIVMAGLQSAAESIEMLVDTQVEQRETLRLVTDSPLRDRRGYQVEGALLCTRDPDPIPTMFSQDIWRKFKKSAMAEQNTADFIAGLRSRSVAYVVESYRLRQFPEPILSFLASHYLWYSSSLFIAGFGIEPGRPAQDIDVIVRGRYRWDPSPIDATATLQVGSVVLRPSEVVELDVGSHRITHDDRDAQGKLILADLPRRDEVGFPSFYLSRQIYQLGGSR